MNNHLHQVVDLQRQRMWKFGLVCASTQRCRTLTLIPTLQKQDGFHLGGLAQSAQHCIAATSLPKCPASVRRGPGEEACSPLGALCSRKQALELVPCPRPVVQATRGRADASVMLVEVRATGPSSVLTQGESVCPALSWGFTLATWGHQQLTQYLLVPSSRAGTIAVRAPIFPVSVLDPQRLVPEPTPWFWEPRLPHGSRSPPRVDPILN